MMERVNTTMVCSECGTETTERKSILEAAAIPMNFTGTIDVKKVEGGFIYTIDRCIECRKLWTRFKKFLRKRRSWK
jgi:hypothetical protein